MASEKYEFKAKNKVISTGANEHISVTEPVEVTVNASAKFNSQALRRKVPSEASDASARVWKLLSEASDASARVWKMPSEASDTFARFGKVLSEVSDTSARFGNMPSEGSDMSARVGKMLSEVSDGFAQVGKVPSETSDAFARFCKVLSEASDGFAQFGKTPSEGSTFAALTTEFLACAANQRFAITARIFVRSAAENRKNSQTFGAQNKLVDHRRMFAMANHK